jgi:hypothetical protein
MNHICDSIHFYEGDLCELEAGHDGDHEDFVGLTWDRGAGPQSALRRVLDPRPKGAWSPWDYVTTP